MRHAHRFLLLLPLLSAGCQRYPEDPVFAYGRALNADGSPLPGATLTLERATPPYFEPGGTEVPPTFSPYGTSTTQANGDFTLQMLWGDVEEVSPDNEYIQYRFRVALPLDANGQGSFLSFLLYGDAELPVLQPWDARLTVSDSAQGPTLTFAPAPPTPPLPPSAKLRTVFVHEPSQSEPEEVRIDTTTPEALAHLFSGGEPLWKQSGVSSPWVPGPHLLEDFASPEVQLRALSLGDWTFSPVGGSFSFTSFRQEWRTARVPLPAGASRPVSRGASCQPSPAGACPWTDGQLTPVPTVGTEEGPPESLVITLAEPTHLGRAVIRGLDVQHAYSGQERVRVEGSVDGEHWTPLAEAVVHEYDPRRAALELPYAAFSYESAWDSPYQDERMDAPYEAPVFLDLPLRTEEPVRHVRLRVEWGQRPGNNLILSSLAEFSVFP